MTVMTSGAERCVVQREGVGATARIIQRRALLLTRIVVDLPTLMVVRQGSKRLIGPGGEITIPAGGAAAIAGGRIFDVINRPAAGGIYEAEWLVCDPAVIAGFAADGEGAGRPIAEAMAIGTMAPDFASAVDRARAAVFAGGDLPHMVAVQRIREVLGWIGHHGGRFAAPPPPSVAARIRALVSRDLRAAWRSNDLAGRLAMSEATLRRRLAAEGLSLTGLLVDIRMSHALMLLQATDLGITRIAFDVGYDSPSRFAARFRQRFGHPPAAVREHVSIRMAVQPYADENAGISAK